MDKLTPEKRSRLMAAVGSRDTKPEMKVRRLAYGLGYRYRLHRKDLHGCPDLAFIGKRKVIFVHGCFWHCHPGCSRASLPQTNVVFWLNKLKANVERDCRTLKLLRADGWDVLVVWECETKNCDALRVRIREFLR
jgi:DNA mismatch endonuclease (patch repair protein)